MNGIKLRVWLLMMGFILTAVTMAWAVDKDVVSRYLCKDMKGNIRWKAAITKTHTGNNGLLLTNEGEGIYYGFKEPVKWKALAEITDDGNNIVPVRSKNTFMSKDGKTIFEAQQEYDYERAEVTYRKKWFDSGREVRKVLRYKGDVVNEFTLGLYVERYLKKGEREKVFYLVSNDPSIYKISATIVAEEDVAINDSVYKTYKIHLDPDVGLLGVFAPATYVWHLASPNFDWLKYHGAEDTINSPVVDMETLNNL